MDTLGYVVGLHHLDLVVSSLERSLSFYRELLEPLGYTRVGDIVGERGETVTYVGGGGPSIGVREARVRGEYDRYRVGIHHVAFEAPSREVVNERYEWARQRGVEIESPPKDYHYMPGYYAFFFYDPDGIKLEVVHAPRKQNQSAELTRFARELTHILRNAAWLQAPNLDGRVRFFTLIQPRSSGRYRLERYEFETERS